MTVNIRKNIYPETCLSLVLSLHAKEKGANQFIYATKQPVVPYIIWLLRQIIIKFANDKTLIIHALHLFIALHQVNLSQY